MNITLLCSELNHPVNLYLYDWMRKNQEKHRVELIRKKNDLSGGDILFLISCSEILSYDDRAKYSVCLVLHASDLPRGRGWSPHVWEILEGAKKITLSLLEIEDRVDTGDIWKKIEISVPEHAIWNEINQLLFSAEMDLMSYAVDNFMIVKPKKQSVSEQPTYYPRRTACDSRIDVNKTIAEQFNMLRICDPDRFPAFFDYLGHRYIVKLEKYDG